LLARRAPGGAVAARAVKPLWRVLLPLRGLAIVLVVMGHASTIPLELHASRAGDGALGLAIGSSWLFTAPLLTAILEVARVSVPLFLFLSGHYLATALLTWGATWKSAGRLLLPFLFWSLFGWAFSWRVAHGGWSPAQFLHLLVSGRAQLGYYFIVLIIQYYALAHWIVPAMRRNPSRTLLVALLIQMSVHVHDYAFLLGELGWLPGDGSLLPSGSFPEYILPRSIFFVALGVWAATEPDRLRAILATKFPCILAGAVVAAALMLAESGHLLHHFHDQAGRSVADSLARSTASWKLSTAFWSLAAILLVLALSLRMTLFSRLLRKLGKEAYMIFLLHGMALELLKAVLLKIDPPFRWDGLLGFALFVAFGLAVPLGIGFAVRRCVRGVFLRRLLIGN
jgi:fucose 4-O-acetylase-like acetyltransferase